MCPWHLLSTLPQSSSFAVVTALLLVADGQLPASFEMSYDLLPQSKSILANCRIVLCVHCHCGSLTFTLHWPCSECNAWLAWPVPFSHLLIQQPQFATVNHLCFPWRDEMAASFWVDVVFTWCTQGVCIVGKPRVCPIVKAVRGCSSS